MGKFGGLLCCGLMTVYVFMNANTSLFYFIGGVSAKIAFENLVPASIMVIIMIFFMIKHFVPGNLSVLFD